MRMNALMNQAEAGAPHVSVTGQTIKHARLLGHNTLLVKRQLSTKGFMGHVTLRGKAIAPIVHQKGYTGELPLRKQPQIKKPRPWETF